MQTKTCSKCQEVKPLTDFYNHRPGKFGVSSRCKKCLKKKSKEWRKNNPEKRKEYKAQYDRNNSEKIKEYNKKWHENNPERVREIDRKYRKNNPEKDNSKNSKRKALIRNSIVENVDLLQLYKNHKYICGICGKKIDKKLRWPNLNSISHDHIIPLSKGGSHTYYNIQPAHLGCNISKSAKITNMQLRLQIT
jgi:hypothetical protein